MTQRELLNQYRRDGALIKRKLIEYIPVMMMTNLSVLLLTSVDGLVVGNYYGSDALSSVNIFYPVILLTGSLSVLTASGIATSMSTASGMNDSEKLNRIRGASLRIMIIMAAAVGIIQIPVVWLVIRSYGLSNEMTVLTWQYAAGVMLSAPLSLISCVGTYQLQIAGKVKTLMWLTVVEGVSNLVFDILFAGVLNMGVAGAGYGTACATLIRCSATVVYLLRHTDMYKSSGYKANADDIKAILACGVPDTSYALVIAFQNFFIIQIILDAFGPDGGAIRGICIFCFSITNVLASGIVQGMKPLLGLLSGADDKKGLSMLMNQGIITTVVIIGAATFITAAFPGLFFTLYGITEVPDGGLLSVRLYSLYFIVDSLNFLFRTYLNNRKDLKYTSILTVVGNGTLPLFAYILAAVAAPPYIFLSYLLTAFLVFVLSVQRYRWWLANDRMELKKNGDIIILYMTVRKEEAADASRQIMAFANENGIDEKTAYRISLCMEEMVAYVRKAKRSASVSVEVMIKFIGKHDAVFVALDDGERITFNKEYQGLITDSYNLIRKIAKSIEYEYILNMNYTKITI